MMTVLTFRRPRGEEDFLGGRANAANRAAAKEARGDFLYRFMGNLGMGEKKKQMQGCSNILKLFKKVNKITSNTFRPLKIVTINNFSYIRYAL